MSEYYPKYTVYFWGPEKALTSRGELHLIGSAAYSI